jgi:hypothetical protein
MLSARAAKELRIKHLQQLSARWGNTWMAQPSGSHEKTATLGRMAASFWGAGRLVNMEASKEIECPRSSQIVLARIELGQFGLGLLETSGDLSHGGRL